MKNKGSSIIQVAFMGTYLPTNEGIATFNSDLIDSFQMMTTDKAEAKVIAVNLSDTSPFYFDKRVNWEIDQESLETYLSVADSLNHDENIKCIIVQHEYGIYGGIWGDYYIKFLKSLKKPVITVLHTVTEDINDNKKAFFKVTDEIIKYSDKLIVLSKTSQKILIEKYGNNGKFVFIPHGIHPVPFTNPKTVKKNLNLGNNFVLTTFGLLSRNKGIEYVIKALPDIVKKFPQVIYQVLGQTHPVILKNEGEKYRTYLIKMIKDLGIRKHVRFIDKYLDLEDILKYLQGTDIYIATSLTQNQTVSGTFSYALGSGRAVVSTEFIQAKEMITPGVGKLVRLRSSRDYRDKIINLLEERNYLLKYHRQAYRKTRDMLWSNIAVKYATAIENIADVKSSKLLLPQININHLIKMTNKHGILQFAKYDIPNIDYGYTADDNARALMVATGLIENGVSGIRVSMLFKKYFDFINNSFGEDNRFINYFDKDMKATIQNKKENPIDHYGRVLLSLVAVITSTAVGKKFKKEAKNLLQKAYDKAYIIYHIRPNALILKSMSLLYLSGYGGEEVKNIIINQAEILVTHYKNNRDKDWDWFEDKVSYNNALLPESLILAYKITGIRKYFSIAKKTFNFLIKHTFMGDIHVPIGQKEWFKKGKVRSFYDQQPEDVTSTVIGLLTMFKVTKNQKYFDKAKSAFSWFLGNNLNGIPVYNNKTGGVYDGLTETGINKNQGAESLLSYLLARINIEKYY